MEPFFVLPKHRANRDFHKFTFSSWLQQILILGDSSQLAVSAQVREAAPAASHAEGHEDEGQDEKPGVHIHKEAPAGRGAGTRAKG